jgi:hypothetical protein
MLVSCRLHIGIDYVLSSHNIELKIFMVTMLAMMVCMFVYFRAQVGNFAVQSTFAGIMTKGVGGGRSKLYRHLDARLTAAVVNTETAVCA